VQGTTVKSILRRKVVIGAIAVAALAGAGGAYAATQSSSTSPSQQEQAYIDDIAARLGVTPSQLNAAIKAADDDQINKALAAGNLTQAEANALKARIDASTNAPFLGGRGLLGGRFFGGRLGDIESAALSYLGITASTLRSDLESGQSLDQIANNTAGKSAAGLKSAIVSAVTDQLNAAVKSGEITNAQETQRLNALNSSIDSVLQQTGVGFGPWGGRRFGRFGGYAGYGAYGGGPGLFSGAPANAPVA
jgi:hypothetical protein